MQCTTPAAGQMLGVSMQLKRSQQEDTVDVLHRGRVDRRVEVYGMTASTQREDQLTAQRTPGYVRQVDRKRVGYCGTGIARVVGDHSQSHGVKQQTTPGKQSTGRQPTNPTHVDTLQSIN